MKQNKRNAVIFGTHFISHFSFLSPCLCSAASSIRPACTWPSAGPLVSVQMQGVCFTTKSHSNQTFLIKMRLAAEGGAAEHTAERI